MKDILKLIFLKVLLCLPSYKLPQQWPPAKKPRHPINAYTWPRLRDRCAILLQFRLASPLVGHQKIESLRTPDEIILLLYKFHKLLEIAVLKSSGGSILKPCPVRLFWTKWRFLHLIRLRSCFILGSTFATFDSPDNILDMVSSELTRTCIPSRIV